MRAAWAISMSDGTGRTRRSTDGRNALRRSTGFGLRPAPSALERPLGRPALFGVDLLVRALAFGIESALQGIDLHESAFSRRMSSV
jgi:hypothetical protein